MADDIARALEALAQDSNRCAPTSASAIRRRGDHRRVAMRAAATGATMTVVGATAGTAVAAHQTSSGDSRLTISGSPSPSSSPSPAPVSIICRTSPQRPLGLTPRAFKQQQKAEISASRGQRKQAKETKLAALARLGQSATAQPTPISTPPSAAASAKVPRPGRSGRVVCVQGSQPTPSPSPRSTVTTTVAPQAVGPTPSPSPLAKARTDRRPQPVAPTPTPRRAHRPS
jgi:hypothetical protein